MLLRRLALGLSLEPGSSLGKGCDSGVGIFIVKSRTHHSDHSDYRNTKTPKNQKAAASVDDSFGERSTW